MRRLIQSSLDATEALTKCLMSATRTPTGDEQSEAENNSIKTSVLICILTNDLTHNVWVIVIHENYMAGKFIF
jgi:hypothetical protein